MWAIHKNKTAQGCINALGLSRNQASLLLEENWRGQRDSAPTSRKAVRFVRGADESNQRDSGRPAAASMEGDAPVGRIALYAASAAPVRLPLAHVKIQNAS